MVRLRPSSTSSRAEGLVLHSYAKLNLYLEVLNKRRDNYHNIKTIFERIDLADRIILKPRQDKKIRIVCSNSSVPKDNSNFCYRSAKLLQESFKIEKGIDIKIIKRIPVNAGLGGGSSNAASILLGLNKLWKLRLCRKRLIEFAKKIGCDVPFFIYDTSFAFACERGDKVKPLSLPEVTHFWHTLIIPTNLKVSTRLIYEKWDRYSKLTRPEYNVRLLILALKKNDPSKVSKALFNSLEAITIKLYPEVQCIKEKLLNLGLKSILMSGSGPAVFGIVSSRKEAEILTRQLKREQKSWQVFVTRTF